MCTLYMYFTNIVHSTYQVHFTVYVCTSTCRSLHVYTALAHTQDNKVTGRQADVIQAAYLAGEIAHRMIVPGGEVQLFH